MANLLGKRKLEDDLKTKPVLKKHKEISEEKESTNEQIEGRVELSVTKCDEVNLSSVKETVDGLDGTPDFVERSGVRERTVFVDNLSSDETQISDIIDFFKDVGQVVRVRLIVNLKLKQMGCGFVEFASANEAKKALQEKNGEGLHDRKIFVDVVKAAFPPKYCIDHKAWYGDNLGRESLPIADDETPPDFVEDASVRGRTLFVANLSPQTTKIIHIIDFFEDCGKVVSVRLIVNHGGKHVGYGFVEFASAKEAKWALENMNGEYLHDHKILLMKGQDKTPDFVEEAALREKTIFVSHLYFRTKVSDIIDFFKDVGQVVHVRLIVNHRANHRCFGFVEFASADEAKWALQVKKSEYLRNRKISLNVVEKAPYPLRTKHCIDHYVWYEDHLRRESLLVEEDAAVERLDETPDLLEELAVREKTVFVASVSLKKESLCDISYIIRMFRSVGEVVRVCLIVDDWGEHVGCCYVEFASANEANKAVQEKNGSSIFVQVAEIARSYPFRPKTYNLYKLAKKLWYEDNLRRVRLDPNRHTLKKQKATFSGKKTTFSDDNATYVYNFACV